MQEITLPRSGLSDVRFTGTLVSSGGLPDDFEFETTLAGKPVGRVQRGHALRLYRTAGGKTVLFIEFQSAWDNEPPYFEVHVIADYREALKVLDEYRNLRVMKQFVGPPPGSLYAQKNLSNLIKSYKLQFDDAVTELAGAFDVEEIE